MGMVAERLGGRRLGEEKGVFNIKSQEKVLPWVTTLSCHGSAVSLQLQEMGTGIQELY